MISGVELCVMKHAWQNSINDQCAAIINSHQTEEVRIGEYKELYQLNKEWARLLDENMI